MVDSCKKQLTVFIGGARKTYKITEEGLPDNAREAAHFFITKRSSSLNCAIKAERDGYILKGKNSIEFTLSTSEEKLAEEILRAMQQYMRLYVPHKPFGVAPGFWF